MKKIKTELNLCPIWVLVGDADNCKEVEASPTGFKVVTPTGREYFQFKYENKFYYHV